jgi:hypothetical protein
VLFPLTVLVFAAAALLAVTAGFYAWRDRLIDDRLLLVAGVLELGLLVQLAVCLVNVGKVTGGGAEQATFAAYSITLPFIPPAVAFLAIKEKTRWAMGVIAAGAFAVAVMTGRLQQIWNLSG